MIEITDKPIDILKVIEAASLHEAGAINTFIGTVRNQTSGKTVLRLEFEAYEPMAVSEIRKIADQANETWNILGYAVSHRVGVLLPGDIAVVIAVAAPHRKASFESCQFIIDSLKRTVPIWKREFFEDGDQWVSAHP